MSPPAESLPKALAATHAMILAERAAQDVERTARLVAEAAVARAHLDRVVLDLELERLRFQLAKARREAFGQSSEAGARIGQFELALEDIEQTLAAMEAADATAASATTVATFTRRKPARRPLPDHLPRVRQVYPSPSACPCCGGRLHKLGEDVTESLERVPASWFVIQHVREKLSCRACEAISHQRPRIRSGAEPGRRPGTIVEAGCWAHWRRKFYEIAALKKAPLAIEAVTRIDAAHYRFTRASCACRFIDGGHQAMRSTSVCFQQRPSLNAWNFAVHNGYCVAISGNDEDVPAA